VNQPRRSTGAEWAKEHASQIFGPQKLSAPCLDQRFFEEMCRDSFLRKEMVSKLLSLAAFSYLWHTTFSVDASFGSNQFEGSAKISQGSFT
jgi:hypothetical protein